MEAEPTTVTRISSEKMGWAAESPEEPPTPLRPIAEAVKATLTHLDLRGGVTLRIDSELPPSSGLGSSSAVAVAAVTAVASSFGHRLQGEEIEKLATVSERILHGNPSGVDVSVAVHGGLILFKRGQPVRRVEVVGNTELVVGVSGIERSTSEMVRRFAEAKDRSPRLFQALVDACSRLGEMAAEAFVKQDLPTLGSFLNYQHIVLKAFGVSAEILDQMVEEALRHGALGAKLTGAGGGGSMIALPLQGGAEGLKAALVGFGADAFITSIPSGGVRTWRLPA